MKQYRPVDQSQTICVIYRCHCYTNPTRR